MNESQENFTARDVLTPPEGPIARKWSLFVMLGEPEYPRRHVEVLFAGAVGSGKTRALAAWVIWRALAYPGIRIALVRDTYENLTRSTLQTLFEAAGPLISQDSKDKDAVGYLVKRENRIKFKNGSSIWMFGLNDPSSVNRLVGTEWGAVAVDQLERVRPDVYETVLTRLRQKVYHQDTGELVFPMAKSTANVDMGRSSWVWRRFVEGSVPLGRGNLADDVRERKVVSVVAGKRVTTYRAYFAGHFGENHSLNEHYELVLAAAGDTAKNFAESEWSASFEQVFPEWDGSLYYETDEFDDYSRFSLIVGYDWGHAAYSVFTFGLWDRHERKLYVDGEYIEHGRDAKDYAVTALQYLLDYVRKGIRDIHIYADPSIWRHTGVGQSIADVMGGVWREAIPRSVMLTVNKAFRQGTLRVTDPQFTSKLKELMRERRIFVHRYKASTVAEVFKVLTWGDVTSDKPMLTDTFDSIKYLAMNLPENIVTIDDEEEEIVRRRRKRIFAWRF